MDKRNEYSDMVKIGTTSMIQVQNLSDIDKEAIAVKEAAQIFLAEAKAALMAINEKRDEAFEVIVREATGKPRVEHGSGDYKVDKTNGDIYFQEDTGGPTLADILGLRRQNANDSNDVSDDVGAVRPGGDPVQ